MIMGILLNSNYKYGLVSSTNYNVRYITTTSKINSSEIIKILTIPLNEYD